MSDDRMVILVSQRRWVEGAGDVRSHYETLSFRVTFPADYLVQYVSDQHSVVLKTPSGQVRAVYRDVTRLLTPDVVIEEPADDAKEDG